MSKTYLNNNIPGNNWGIIYSLINLEESSEGYNIVIQSITQSDVKEAPTFDEFYNSIRKKDYQHNVNHITVKPSR